MAIYISPFDNYDGVVENFGDDLRGWKIMVYVSDNRSPGFEVNRRSSAIFSSLLEEMVWYDAEKQLFNEISCNFLSTHILKIRGLVFQNYGLIQNEVILEQKRILINKKNQLLRRYNKILEEEPCNLIHNLFNSEKQTYRLNVMLDILRICPNYCLVLYGIFGRYLLYNEQSNLESKLANCIDLFNESIVNVPNIDLIPDD